MNDNLLLVRIQILHSYLGPSLDPRVYLQTVLKTISHPQQRLPDRIIANDLPVGRIGIHGALEIDVLRPVTKRRQQTKAPANALEATRSVEHP